MDNLQVRMYLFTGFLESGKSTFINDTIVNTNFTDGERSVLIVTEEGEVEYKKEELEAKGTHMIVVEDPEEFTLDFWNKIKEDYDPTQILIEFNGMWDVDKFIEKERPDGWQIVQILTTINASTFQLFVQNMRALLFQHCSRSDLVIFNRLPKGAKKRPYRNNIKAMNPQCQIIYELEDGTVDNNVEEELPYNYEDHDLNIEDHDFGIFCYDLMEHPERYDNKHIRIKGKFIGKDRVQENGFVLGRYAMVCCEQDTSLIGLICISKEYRDKLIPNEWIIVEGDTHTQYDPEYGQNICVMDVTKLEGTKPLSYEYVTFD
jgi:uncharacterized membrane protein YcgQ (UPF0703/DUF1980 family)